MEKTDSKLSQEKNQNHQTWKISFFLINSINRLGNEDLVNNEDPNLAVGKPWLVFPPSPMSRTAEAF